MIRVQVYNVQMIRIKAYANCNRRHPRNVGRRCQGVFKLDSVWVVSNEGVTMHGKMVWYDGEATVKCECDDNNNNNMERCWLRN